LGALVNLSRNEWVEEIVQLRPLYLNEQEHVVEALMATFGVSATYFIYRDKEKPIISFIALGNRKKIFNPLHFLYSAFWVEGNLSDPKYAESVSHFLKELTAKFNNIEIRLPTSVNDVRPFIWNNFTVSNFYTYVKDLEEQRYHPSTTKNIRKTADKGYECKRENINEDNLALNMQLLTELQVYPKTKVAIEKFLKSVSSKNEFSCYSCYLNGKLIASNIMFLDAHNKIAYTVLLNKVANEVKDDVHSLLHHFFFKDLREAGFAEVDLLGGDMQNIAAFKARMYAHLKPHFVVSYSKNKSVIKHSLHRCKYMLKKIISKF
jgi:hypothetical protein